MQSALVVPTDTNVKDLFQWLEGSSKLLTPFCFAAGLATLVYQTQKRTRAMASGDQPKKSLDEYQYRDLFHFFINPEFHPDKLHLAKGRRKLTDVVWPILICSLLEFSDRMHAEALEYMKRDHADDPDFPDQFTYIPYDKEKVNQRLDYIFQRLFQQRYLDCQ